MASWQTIQSLLIFFGPLLVPRLISYYRSIRARPKSQLKPLNKRTSYALAVLFLSATIAFLSTLPTFQPTNIFTATKSRLHTPASVLLTRLAALRPLSEADEVLRSVFNAGGLEARLLYAHYGPEVTLSNPLISSSAPTFSSSSSDGSSGPNSKGSSDGDVAMMALLYATPSLLFPHLLHVLVLATATSSLLFGKEASRWRTVAVISALALAVLEFGFVATYDDRPNARSTRVGEIDFVFWKLAVYRGLAIAGVDALLGWVIWAQGTGRVSLGPVAGKGEKFNECLRGLEGLLGRARGVGVVRNGVSRSAEMRRQVEGYWIKEGEVMRDVFEQPEVLQAQRNALRRVDVARVGGDAEGFLDTIFGEARMGDMRVGERGSGSSGS